MVRNYFPKNIKLVIKWFVLCFFLMFVQSVQAAEPVPGNVCSPDNTFVLSGGPGTTDVHLMVCIASTWTSAFEVENATADITFNGKVGIGTNAPARDIHLRTVNGQARFEATVNNRYVEIRANGGSINSNNAKLTLNDTTAQNVKIADGGGDIELVGGGGDVIIGVGTPSAKLDVVGSAEVNGNLTVTGAIRVNGVNFTADNSTWVSLGVPSTNTGSAGGVAQVICSTHHTTSAGRSAMYLVYLTNSSGSPVVTYIGGQPSSNIFSFRDNAGNLEVKGWDSGIGLSVAAACAAIGSW